VISFYHIVNLDLYEQQKRQQQIVTGDTLSEAWFVDTFQLLESLHAHKHTLTPVLPLYYHYQVSWTALNSCAQA
jgi:hypothetical protein